MTLSRYNLVCWLSTLLLALVFAAPTLAQQPGPVQYVYDALGRLVKVIDGEGNVAEYVYDAVGNILEIRRSTLSGLAIFDFSPQQGPVGTVVAIQGQGFSATPADNLVEEAESGLVFCLEGGVGAGCANSAGLISISSKMPRRVPFSQDGCHEPVRLFGGCPG